MVFAFGDCELDEERWELRRAGAMIAVQPKELALLFYLVRHRDRVVNREELLEALWPGIFVGDGTLTRAVSLARLAIGGRDRDGDGIQTIARRGYRFSAAVRVIEPPATPATVRQEEQPAVSNAPSDPDGASAASHPSRVFVGRERELRELRAGLADAIAGRGRCFMLAGEPGIGKTRLADELAAHGTEAGAVVLIGRCWEGGGAPPYWPWVQILRTYMKDRDPEALRRQMGPGAGEITQFVGGVPPVACDLQSEVDNPQSMDPEQARFRQFDATTTFLKNAAAVQPLVMIFDDLHAADPTSLLLLRFVAREIRGMRGLILGTYRDEEARRGAATAEVLGEIGRDSHRIPLRGLNESEVALFVQHAAGRAPSEQLVGAIYEATGGNPFFVDEVVRMLVADGRFASGGTTLLSQLRIPSQVREAVRRHLRPLSPAACRLLDIAAVIGREFDLRVLERAEAGASAAGDADGPLSHETVLNLIGVARTCGILSAMPPALGHYRFAHALIRETLYDDLDLSRRLELHRCVGEALEAVHQRDLAPHLPTLARHFFETSAAGYTAKAVEYNRKAGDRALALLAYEEAASHYANALQVADLDTQPDDARRCDLLLALGDAQWKAGTMSTAADTFRRAALVAHAAGMSERLARAALGSGVWVVTPRNVPIDLLEEALRGVGAADAASRIRVMARLVQALPTSAAERQISLSGAALDAARRLGDRVVLGYALAARRSALRAPEYAEERFTISNEVVKLGEELPDRELAFEGYAIRSVSRLEIGDAAGARSDMEARVQLGNALRQPHLQWASESWAAMWLLLEGRLQAAEEMASRSWGTGERLGQAAAAGELFLSQAFMLRMEQARLDELEVQIGRAIDQYSRSPDLRGWLDLPDDSGWRAALALLHSETGRTREARTAFEQFATNGFADLSRDRNWLTCVGFLAQTCVALDDQRRAATLYEMLLPYADYCCVLGFAYAFAGSVSRYLALLAATVERWDDAVQHFVHALATHTRMGAVPFVARTQLEWGRMLLRRGTGADRVRAFELLNEASATATGLGLTSIAQQARALFEANLRAPAEASGLSEDYAPVASRIGSVDVAPEPTGIRVNLFRKRSEFGERVDGRTSSAPTSSAVDETPSKTTSVRPEPFDVAQDRSVERLARIRSTRSRKEGEQKSATTDQRGATSIFRRKGDIWTITFDGATIQLRDSKGLHYLTRLLGAPGREFHALDLIAELSAISRPATTKRGTQAATSHRRFGIPVLGCASQGGIQATTGRVAGRACRGGSNARSRKHGAQAHRDRDA